MKNNLLNPYVRGLASGADTSMHEDAKLMKTPSVEPGVGMFLEYTAYLNKPKNVLELGCGIGVSTRYIARGAPDAHITAVDYNKGRLKHAMEKCSGINAQFVYSDVLDHLESDKSAYDMIFVDSMKKQYPIVFHHAFNLLNEGGVLIFDDMFVYGDIFCADCEISPKYLSLVKTMREFIEYIKHTYRHTLLPIGGGVMLVGK